MCQAGDLISGTGERGRTPESNQHQVLETWSDFKKKTVALDRIGVVDLFDLHECSYTSMLESQPEPTEPTVFFRPCCVVASIDWNRGENVAGHRKAVFLWPKACKLRDLS